MWIMNACIEMTEWTMGEYGGIALKKWLRQSNFPAQIAEMCMIQKIRNWAKNVSYSL
jgi:hypothetical protein